MKKHFSTPIYFLLLSILIIIFLLITGYFVSRISCFSLNNRINNQITSTNGTSESIEATTTIIDDYDKYIEQLDKICPFDSTDTQSDCLDKEYNKQEQRYELLFTKILNFVAQKIKENSEYAEILTLNTTLETLSDYNENRKNYIEKTCSLKNALTTGTAIIIQSRQCWIYYVARDIVLLEDIDIGLND